MIFSRSSLAFSLVLTCAMLGCGLYFDYLSERINPPASRPDGPIAVHPAEAAAPWFADAEYSNSTAASSDR